MNKIKQFITVQRRAFSKNHAPNVQIIPKIPGYDTNKNNYGLLEDGTIISELGRSIISVRGPDATLFLQNLITQDMKLFKEQQPDRAAIYTSFLNAKGKLLFDCIIIKPRLAGQDEEGGEIEYWIDVAKGSDASDLLKHLKRYALRKRLEIKDLSDVLKSYQIQTLNGVHEEQLNHKGVMGIAEEGHYFKIMQDSIEMHENEEFPGELETDVAAFIDPRTNMMGVRVVCADGSLEIEDPTFIQRKDTEEYDIIRYMMGIPETSKELGGQFPLNMHLHHLNGASFTKGCYIGQELTQRTYHTGVIRRIALPFLLISNDDMKQQNFQLNMANFIPIQHVDKKFDLDVENEIILGKANGEDSKSIKLGKVLINKYNTGIAQIDITKLDNLGANAQYTLDDYRVLLWQPMWLNMVLHNDENSPKDDEPEV